MCLGFDHRGRLSGHEPFWTFKLSSSWQAMGHEQLNLLWRCCSSLLAGFYRRLSYSPSPWVSISPFNSCPSQLLDMELLSPPASPSVASSISTWSHTTDLSNRSSPSSHTYGDGPYILCCDFTVIVLSCLHLSLICFCLKLQFCSSSLHILISSERHVCFFFF